MKSQEAFIAQLRRQRVRSLVTLDEIAKSARIPRDLLEAFERGDLSGWPKGLYARAWIRAYAEEVKLDATETVDEFCRLFPIGDRRAQRTMNELASILDMPSGFRDDEAIQGAAYGRRVSDRVAPPPTPSLRDRVARAMRIVGDIRHMRDLPVRLVESWRTLRPSPPAL